MNATTQRTLPCLLVLAAAAAWPLCGAEKQPAPRGDGAAEARRAEAQRVLDDPAATPLARGLAMLQAARALERSAPAEALRWIERALPELDLARKAGEPVARDAGVLLEGAGILSREKHGYETAMRVFEHLLACSSSPDWQSRAQLQIGSTWRAQGAFDKAEAAYAAAEARSPAHAADLLMLRAEMTTFDMGREQDGLKLLDQAFIHKQIPGYRCFPTLFRLADRLRQRGDYEAAVQWLAKVPELPEGGPGEGARYTARAWYEIGRIDLIRNRVEAAKARFRQAMELEGGEMLSRVAARNALEEITYFE